MNKLEGQCGLRIVMGLIMVVALPMATVPVAAADPPSAPEMLVGVAVPSEDSPYQHIVNLVWQPPSNVSGEEILSYNVYRAANELPDGTAEYELAGYAVEPNYSEIVDTAQFILLSYFVTAVTAAGEGAPSNNAYVASVGVWLGCLDIVDQPLFVHIRQCWMDRYPELVQTCPLPPSTIIRKECIT